MFFASGLELLSHVVGGMRMSDCGLCCQGYTCATGVGGGQPGAQPGIILVIIQVISLLVSLVIILVISLVMLSR